MGPWECIFLGWWWEAYSSCGLPCIHSACGGEINFSSWRLSKHLPRRWESQALLFEVLQQNLFSVSKMRFVASATSFSVLLSGTKPPSGIEAQREGKRKLLSSNISLVILGEQFSTELVSKIPNTFSYSEREWHNWALSCDLNSQINIWMATRPSPGINPLHCPSFSGRYDTAREGTLNHYCLRWYRKLSRDWICSHDVTLVLVSKNKAGEEETTLPRGLSCLFSKVLRKLLASIWY